jgi:hypothetical protein
MRFFVSTMVCMSILLLSGCGGGKSSAPKSPAQKAFDDANLLITAKSKGIAHGNTETAIKRAAGSSETMEKLQKVAFTGGDKNRTVSLTGEKFLVYCQEAPDGVCFLVHVPQLKNYKNDVRVALANLAWTTAKMMTVDLQKEKPLKLAVGLRGSLMYGALATGKSDEDPKIEESFSVDKDPLIPFFAPSAAAQPAVSTPKPVASDSKKEAAATK